MHVELRCPGCPCRFRAPLHLSAEETLARMIDAGSWYALAAGATFRDMIRTTLVRRGYISCPDCGRAVAIDEGGPGQPAPSRRAARGTVVPAGGQPLGAPSRRVAVVPPAAQRGERPASESPE
jgi:hypothetical protein